MGAVLDPVRIPQLRCAAVVGCANNQLADPSCAKLLADQGVLYAPDYVVNAGGIINIAEELSPAGYHPDRALAAVRRVFDTTAAVLATAEAEGITTAEAADRQAERRIDAIGRVHQIRA
jgi:valine dehydrogenase (NAD+)